MDPTAPGQIRHLPQVPTSPPIKGREGVSREGRHSGGEPNTFERLAHQRSALGALTGGAGYVPTTGERLAVQPTLMDQFRSASVAGSAPAGTNGGTTSGRPTLPHANGPESTLADLIEALSGRAPTLEIDGVPVDVSGLVDQLAEALPGEVAAAPEDMTLDEQVAFYSDTVGGVG